MEWFLRQHTPSKGITIKKRMTKKESKTERLVLVDDWEQEQNGVMMRNWEMSNVAKKYAKNKQILPQFTNGHHRWIRSFFACKTIRSWNKRNAAQRKSTPRQFDSTTVFMTSNEAK